MNELSANDSITGHAGCAFPDLQVIGQSSHCREYRNTTEKPRQWNLTSTLAVAVLEESIGATGIVHFAQP